MKFKIACVLYVMFWLCPIGLDAQQFTQVQNGNIVTSNNSTGGCSWADYNNDGYPDLFLSNTNTRNQLFKNNGDGTFQEITSGIIVNNAGVSNTAIWGDYDNDGNLDLFVSNNPSNTLPPELNFLYKNNGAPDYDFSTVSMPGTQMDANYTWSSSWVDYDNDGDLDLHMPDNKHLRRDFFYENNGNGGFTSISPSFVTPNVESTGVVSWIDYDHDGDQDLFMIKSGRTHPSGREDNRMYHNMLSETGNLEFRRVHSAAMVNHFDLDFQASWGDYDNDGDMDVYLGNFDNRNYLYRNEGDSLFTRITTGPAALDFGATLGSTWGDFDNDGDLDLYVGNTGGQRSKYYQNDGSGNFSSLNFLQVGPPVTNVSNLQGCASADYNNDGYLDLYIPNSFSSGNGRNYMYLNAGGTNSFIELTCKGRTSNAAAIGAKIWIKAMINGSGVWQLRHITGSPTGNRAQNDLRVHFGLGDAGVVDSLIIEWPLGLKEIYTGIPVNQFLEFTEGQTTRVVEVKERNIELTIYPNPANAEATIYLQSKASARIRMSITDVLQSTVVLKYDRIFHQGIHEIKLNASGWAAGIYQVMVEADREKLTRKIVIIK